MRLTEDVQSQIVDRMAGLLAYGTIRIYEAPRPERVSKDPTFREPLVWIPLLPFPPAENGQTSIVDLEPGQIQQTGDAAWAELVTASGELVADLSVGTNDADVVLDRTDLHRAGLCRISLVTLRLP